MKKLSHYHRTSGVLAHITSLPSPFGIGDLGTGAYSFLEFLQRSEQSIWQILPLGPTDAALSHSPYMTVSAFAGNPLLISPEILFREGFLYEREIESYPQFSPYTIDFINVLQMKTELLHRAFERFVLEKSDAFTQFVEETDWLGDYCLFMALKNHYHGTAWYQWDKPLVNRENEALRSAEITLEKDIRYFQFEQFIFARQWHSLHLQAQEKNIRLFGDIPIYVSLDSADVWANQPIFLLDRKTCQPTHVAGVPPDYFSATGQKWGNPLYCWNSEDSMVNEQLMRWWTSRFKAVFQQVDIARIDHFRGFQAFWAVPAENETALEGEWLEGPKAPFFHHVFEKLGHLDIVAEDLGEITEDVRELREELNFPGMRVLQFAFDGNVENSFLPFNFETPNTFVYTGTHDNNTSLGWYLSDRLDDSTRSRVKKTANRELHDGHGIHRDLIYMAMSSTAVVCIFPLQDILGFGEDCRMNTPGTDTGNWLWRCSEEFLNDDIATWLRDLTVFFGRKARHSEKSQTDLSHKNQQNLDKADLFK
ncbi:MAG: 4-alpha-glucanotransferase [Desulfopila sp.]|jgi:4-alpha-glucanotransferase|nr:4-alpha-glucanotransferase [Desulfopila sp.]